MMKNRTEYVAPAPVLTARKWETANLLYLMGFEPLACHRAKLPQVPQRNASNVRTIRREHLEDLSPRPWWSNSAFPSPADSTLSELRAIVSWFRGPELAGEEGSGAEDRRARAGVKVSLRRR